MATNSFLIFRRYVQCLFQFLILIIGKILLQPFTRVDTTSVKSKSIYNRGYLLVANHRKFLDPFIVGCCLPVGTIFKIVPTAFMTHNGYYDSPLKPLLWLAGGYPARNPKENHKIYGVEGSVELLRNGFSVFIFPEGKRMPAGERGPAKSGVVRIHQLAPDVPLIIAHIEYKRGLKAWLTGRRVVHYGLIEGQHFDDPEKIMDRIFAL